jgi:hypothetical protein
MIVDQDGLAVIGQNIALGHDFAQPINECIQCGGVIRWRLANTSRLNLVQMGPKRKASVARGVDECRRDFGWKLPRHLPPRLMPAPCAVQAVNWPIMNRAVGARPGIEIDPSDRNGLAEVDLFWPPSRTASTMA